MKATQVKLKWSNYQNVFSHYLQRYCNQSLFSDAMIACEGQIFMVHRIILSACSHYFEEIFQKTPSDNARPVIVFNDISVEILEWLLLYMYCGEVTIPRDSIFSLFSLAEKLKIKELSQQQDPELDKRHVVPGNVEGQNDGSVNINASRKLKRKFLERSNLQTKKSTSSVSLGLQSDSSSCVLTPPLQTVAKSSVSLKLTSKSSSCMLTPPLQTVAKSPLSLELPSDCMSCVLTPPLQTDTKSSVSQELPSSFTSCALTSPFQTDASSSVPLELQSDSVRCVLTPPLQTDVNSSVPLELQPDSSSCMLTLPFQTDAASPTTPSFCHAKPPLILTNSVSGLLSSSNAIIKPSTAPLKDNVGAHLFPPSTDTVPSPSRPVVAIPLSALSAEIRASIISCTQVPILSDPLVGKSQGTRSSVPLKTVIPSSGSSTVAGTSTAKHNGLIVVEGTTFKFFPAGRTTDLPLLPEFKDEGKEPVILGPDGTLSILSINEAASDPEAVKEQANGGVGEGSKEQASGEERGASSSPPDVFSQIVQPCLEMSEIKEEKKEPIILGPDDPLLKDDYDDDLASLSGDTTSMLLEVTSLYVSTSSCELGVRQAASDQGPVSEQVNNVDGEGEGSTEHVSGEEWGSPSSPPDALSQIVQPCMKSHEIRAKRKEGLFTFGSDDSLPLDDDDDNLSNWSDDDSRMLPDLTYLVPTSTLNHALSNKQAASDTETITEQANGGEVEYTKEQANGEEGGGPSSPPNMLSKIVKPYVVMPEVEEVGKKEIVTLGPSHPFAIDGGDLGSLSDNILLMPKGTSSLSTSTLKYSLSVKQATSDPEQASGREREDSKEQDSGKEGRGSGYPPDALSQIVQPCVVMLSRLLKTPEIKEMKKEPLHLGPGDPLSLDDYDDDLNDDILPDLTLVPNSAPNNALSMKHRASDPETAKQANGGEGEDSKELDTGEEGGGLSSPLDVLTRIVQPCMKMRSSQRRLASATQPKNYLVADEVPVSVVKKQLAVKRQLDLEEEGKPLSVTKKNILESDSKVAGCPHGRLHKPKVNTQPYPFGRISKEKSQKKKFSASEVNTPKPKILNDGITESRAVSLRPRRPPHLQVSKLDKKLTLPGNDEGHNDSVYVDLPKTLKKTLSENSNVKIKKATSSMSSVSLLPKSES
ncbi:uncharacterized protein [Macrobrachium rosenbergii]|uniref:uncharacterized protein isoform X2 n=1 Tax=Macrobrachium rosenbergii TaxID=79674 RepID=UPI0034D6DC2F